MRVLMTADAVGGVWTYALELARALADHDTSVVLATMGPLPSSQQREDAQMIRGLELHCSDAKLEWMDDPWDQVDRAGDWLLRLARRYAVDVVHLNGYAHAALQWRSPVLVVAHSCVYSWWRAVHGTDPPSDWQKYFRRVRAGLHAADCVAAPTAAFLAQLTSIYGSLPRTAVIHNARSDIHLEESSASRLPVALSCGRLWDAAKNLRPLDVAGCKVSCPIYVAGSLRSPDGVVPRFESLCSLGELRPADLAMWFSRCAVYVHPALYEPFGLAILEAAQAGCALVLADVDTQRELWTGAATFVDGRNEDAIANAVQLLIDDPAYRQSMADAARNRAAQFSPATAASAYASLYRDLCGSSRRRQIVA